MKIAPILYAAYKELENAAKGKLKGTKIEDIADIINRNAIYSAASQTVAVFGGIGSVVAIIAQTGIIWNTYLKINEKLGISLSENAMKFVASAVLTNIITNAGVYIVAAVLTWTVGLIPIFNIATIAIGVVIAYIIVYVSAIIYMKILTEYMNAKGTFDITETDDTKKIIKDVVKNANVKNMIKEGRATFRDINESGEFDKIKNNPQCPKCGKAINLEQNFCPSCGTNLK